MNRTQLLKVATALNLADNTYKVLMARDSIYIKQEWLKDILRKENRKIAMALKIVEGQL